MLYHFILFIMELHIFKINIIQSMYNYYSSDTDMKKRSWLLYSFLFEKKNFSTKKNHASFQSIHSNANVVA